MSSQQWLQGQVLDLRAYGKSKMKSLTSSVNSTSKLGLNFRETMSHFSGLSRRLGNPCYLRSESFHRFNVHDLQKIGLN